MRWKALENTDRSKPKVHWQIPSGSFFMNLCWYFSDTSLILLSVSKYWMHIYIFSMRPWGSVLESPGGSDWFPLVDPWKKSMICEIFLLADSSLMPLLYSSLTDNVGKTSQSVSDEVMSVCDGKSWRYWLIRSKGSLQNSFWVVFNSHLLILLSYFSVRYYANI